MMQKPKFATGDKVTSNTPMPRNTAPLGVFTITRVMPFTGVTFEYRARSDADQHERVFEEGQLSAVHG
jgi:hypothetical protein